MTGLDIHEDVAEQIALIKEIADSALFDPDGESVIRVVHAVEEGFIELRRKKRIISVVPCQCALGTEPVVKAPDQCGNALGEYPQPRPMLADFEVSAQIDADSRFIDQHSDREK